MSGPASRRALLCGLAVLPVLGGTALATVPSDLALACDWAIGYRDWIDSAGLDDDALDEACDRHESVIIRAIEEPSRSASDIAAKARLLLQDLQHGGTVDSQYNDDRLIVVVLREVIASCA